jgi:Fuc2NAc and GlcNAc transferase
MTKGERWYEPHRTHAYQKLARRVGHRPIAIGVATIDVLILGPVAWLAWLHPKLGFPLMLSVNAILAILILTVRDSVDRYATKPVQRASN